MNHGTIVSTSRRVTFTVIAWVIALFLLFPILWTIITSFKSEGGRDCLPPVF